MLFDGLPEGLELPSGNFEGPAGGGGGLPWGWPWAGLFRLPCMQLYLFSPIDLPRPTELLGALFTELLLTASQHHFGTVMS